MVLGGRSLSTCCERDNGWQSSMFCRVLESKVEDLILVPRFIITVCKHWLGQKDMGLTHQVCHRYLNP
jgi:hypothetical protein